MIDLPDVFDFRPLALQVIIADGHIRPLLIETLRRVHDPERQANGESHRKVCRDRLVRTGLYGDPGPRWAFLALDFATEPGVPH